MFEYYPDMSLVLCIAGLHFFLFRQLGERSPEGASNLSEALHFISPSIYRNLSHSLGISIWKKKNPHFK
jgi:hypothetical protein